ncbi:phage major capsid protein, P2 family [Lysobacter gummosus]|uniref:phage major capsid protein, P2 family n=1 Tax=Lysobacter gummosus TaxID=262324 RepID=UPI0036263780
MRNDTRRKFHGYTSTVAKINDVDSAYESFNVTPSVQQVMEERIQQSSSFLQSVNVQGVDEIKGEKVGLGVGGPIASRTDTTQSERVTRDPTSFDSNTYECFQTNFDTHLTYAKLDAWAKSKNFQTMVRDAILKRCALDRIQIGFNGQSIAANTDIVKFPLLQDVNKGWLQHYREQAPARVLKDGKNAGTITVGPGGDFENLDALVMDAVSGLIDPWHRRDTNLVAILGSDLLHDKYFPMVNKTQAPSEQLSADIIISKETVGGKAAVQVPFMPDDTIIITRLDNLSIYYQEGARRRHFKDNPARNRIENFESSNEAYVVEDFGCGCVIQNIKIVR